MTEPKNIPEGERETFPKFTPEPWSEEEREAVRIDPDEALTLLRKLYDGVTVGYMDHAAIKWAINRLSTPPSVSAREAAERVARYFVGDLGDWDGAEASAMVEVLAPLIASAIAPFEEQIREKEREIERRGVIIAEEVNRAEAAEARLDKAVSALKAILVQSNGPNCAAIAHEALSEIETKEAAE